MGLVFKGAVPKPPPQPSCDLNGDRVKDVMPAPRDFSNLSSYGALQNGSRTIPFTSAPRGIFTGRQFPSFQKASHYIACTDPQARFYPPNSKSLLSFSIGMRVALLSGDGKVQFPMTITGFVVGLESSLTPVKDRAGHVLTQAIEMQGETVCSQTLVQDLVWITGSGERVHPNWVLSPPPKIRLTPSEVLLKPLFEEVQAMPEVPLAKERLRMIDAALHRWASTGEDPERAQALTTPPMREALKRALGILSGLAPKDL
jgi:hypothetical protein